VLTTVPSASGSKSLWRHEHRKLHLDELLMLVDGFESYARVVGDIG
jgi:hypothetical protein